MNTPIDNAVFWKAFQESDRELRLRHARVGCVLALILMPAGSTLDAVVYPELFWSILQVRWLTNVFIAVVLGLLATSFGKRQVRILGSAWVFMPAIAIAWMIAISEGTASPYYAGLNLVIIIGCLLMPYTLLEAAIVCAIVLVLYFVACLAHPAGHVWSATFYNNIYFIVLTAIIAVASCHYYHRRRVEDFRLRHELDARNRELAELDRLKNEFFANISHELRTPLTLILGPVEHLLQQQSPPADRVQGALELVRKNSLRLLKMINDLLEIVRLDARRSGDTEPKTVVDVARLSRGCAENVRHMATHKGLTLDVTGEAENLPVVGDSSALEKVLLNLLTNAIKFTPQGGRISLACTSDDGKACIEVADTGIGIPPEHLPHIFDRFRQVDGSATRQFRGLGLGLALVRELVDEHGGDMDVQSTQGQGTTFTVRLPLTDRSAQSHAEPANVAAVGGTADPLIATFLAADQVAVAESEPEVTPAEQGDGDHRVLVIDDEPDMRRFLVSILAEEHTVEQAVDGESGLAKALANPPDLIVLDMMLPGIDGLEVCRRMRANDALDDTRIVMLTARADEQTKLVALKHGADDFLTKPFSSVEVRTRIRNLLRTLTLQRDLRRHNRELEAALKELSATRNQLIQSEKMNALGSLAAGLLHEINNPLNYALTALELAEADLPEDNADLREMVADVGEGMRRIRDIITDLRTFAYPERMNNRGIVRMRDVVETAMRFTSHECEGTTIDVDVQDHVTAWGSPSQLTQVLVNLLANAIRATESTRDRRPATIQVSATSANSHCTLTVRDNGVGMTPEIIQRVFDPFFTTQDVGQGMGLGLSICHTIVNSHGGTLTVRSEPDAWTEVTLELPADQPEKHTTDDSNQ